jgi:2,3-bisphosphoglycerate-independent phosphoglycerate mutase
MIILNFANPDMVGHTGIFEAAKAAVEAVDVCLGKVVDKVLEKEGTVFITADHGNAEQMIDYSNGNPMTAHTTDPVPFLYIAKDAKEMRDGGVLADIAPTMLGVMALEIPAEMTGKSLIKK